jgi:hypothetical protein
MRVSTVVESVPRTKYPEEVVSEVCMQDLDIIYPSWEERDDTEAAWSGGATSVSSNISIEPLLRRIDRRSTDGKQTP